MKKVCSDEDSVRSVLKLYSKEISIIIICTPPESEQRKAEKSFKTSLKNTKANSILIFAESIENHDRIFNQRERIEGQQALFQQRGCISQYQRPLQRNGSQGYPFGFPHGTS